MNFDTVLFSGSIVATGYDWARYLDANRVKYVANYRARRDVWPKLAPYVVKGSGRTGVDGFEAKHVALFQHEHAKYGHSDYFTPLTFEDLWLPKLAVPQRQMIENLSGLLVQASQLLRTVPAAVSCLARARLFHRTRAADLFCQFPGMHMASGEAARYDDRELEYVITRESTLGPLPACPPAFQAAFTQTPTQWSAVDQTQTRKGRADILAAVAAALVASPADAHASLGMVVLEVVAPDVDNHPGLATAVRPLLQQLSELVVTMGVEMQALFPKEWP